MEEAQKGYESAVSRQPSDQEAFRSAAQRNDTAFALHTQHATDDGFEGDQAVGGCAVVAAHQQRAGSPTHDAVYGKPVCLGMAKGHDIAHSRHSARGGVKGADRPERDHVAVPDERKHARPAGREAEWHIPIKHGGQERSQGIARE